MNLYTKYFTYEGRINRSKQKLERLLNKNFHDEALGEFKKLFRSLSSKKRWRVLEEICRQYLKYFPNDSARIEKKVTPLRLKNILLHLEENNSIELAIDLCGYFNYHQSAIGLYAKTSNCEDLFLYVERKEIITKEILSYLIHKWEQQHGPISIDSVCAQHLKSLAVSNPGLIPDQAHIKESIEAYEEAALLYKAEKQLRKAAACYESAKKYEAAIELYKTLNEKAIVSKLSEEIGDYEAAFEYAVNPERKFQLLLHTERLEEAPGFLQGFRDKDYYLSLVREKAKKLVEKKLTAYDYIGALRCLEIAETLEGKDDIIEKGRIYYLQQQLNSNDEVQTKAFIEKRIVFEVSATNYPEAGKIAEDDLKDIPLAIEYYEKANLFNLAIRLTSSLLSDAENSTAIITKLAELHKKGGSLLKAGHLYVSINAYKEAYEIYNALGNPGKALECYLKLPNQSQDVLLELYNAIGNEEKMIAIYLKKNTRTALEAALKIAEKNNNQAAILRIERELAAINVCSEKIWSPLYEAALNKVKQEYCSIAGIDFGTTTSICAIYNKSTGKTEVVTTSGDDTYIDSYFAINEAGQYVFGNKAKLLSLTNPEWVIPRVKRHLGEGKTFTIQDKKYITEEVIAHQLLNLKKIINTYLANKIKEIFGLKLAERNKNIPLELIDDFFQTKSINFVNEVVLSVPSYFNDSQKRSTREAAEIAGLHVRRLLHESTAAAVAFEHQRNFKGKIAVIDLGGGTLDVSIVDISETDSNHAKVFDVEKIGGNARLGGSDVDEYLFLYFKKEIKEAYGIELTDHKHATESTRLREACEQLKINLSEQASYAVELPFFLNIPNYRIELSRAALERISEPFFADFKQAVHEILEAYKEPINCFILAGNATKMPKIREISDAIIKGRQLKGLDPGTVVAVGAAVDAAILAGDISNRVVLDIVPFSLGIEVQEGSGTQKLTFKKMIECNTTIPYSKTSVFSTARDYQDAVNINIYQGESNMTHLNHFLGRIDLSGISPAIAGIPQIDVTFEISADCILTVKAYDKATKKEKSVEINGVARLNVAEKQNLIRQFENKSGHEETGKEINRLGIKLKESSEVFGRNSEYVRQLDPIFIALFSEKLLPTYKANKEQAKIIQSIFLEKEDVFLANKQGIEKFATLNSNVQKTFEWQIDYTAANMPKTLAERLLHLEQLETAFEKLNKRYESEVVKKLDLWVDTLNAIEPDLKKLDLLQQINYLLLSNQIAEATVLLETNWQNHKDDVAYIELFLDCYEKSENIEMYKKTISSSNNLLGIPIPDFNHLNQYLENIAESVFNIETQNKDGMWVNGSGFCIADHLIVTNRHWVENAATIKVIGKTGTFLPIEVHIDVQNEMALLKVNEPLKKLRLGVSGFTEPGEKVIAAGFLSAASDTFSENICISQGEIHSIRKIQATKDPVIFVGNQIENGMNGGPLLNDIGEVVGILSLLPASVGDNVNSASQFVALPIPRLPEIP